MPLLRYLLKRIVLIIPLLMGITVITFILSYLLPGNPALVRLGGSPAAEAIAAMEEAMGLNKPVWTQFWIYLTNLLRGDLGKSWMTGRPVIEDIGARLPATMELALMSYLIVIVVGIPLGVLAAIRRDTIIDHFCRLIGVGGISIPLFWLGLMMIFVLFFVLRIFPAPMGRIASSIPPPQHITGFYMLDIILTNNWPAFKSSLSQITLPSLALATVSVAPVMRMTRSAMLDVLQSTYIQAERAAGLPDRSIQRDALKNALIPIITVMGMGFGFLIARVIIIEQVFTWPGIGLYALQSMSSNDRDPMQAYILIMGLIFVTTNLIVDILYGLIDPRIKY